MRNKRFPIHSFIFTIKYPKPESREAGRKMHINIFFLLDFGSQRCFTGCLGWQIIFKDSVCELRWVPVFPSCNSEYGSLKKAQVSTLDRQSNEPSCWWDNTDICRREKFTIFHYYNGKVLHVFSGWSAILNFWRQKCYMRFGYSVNFKRQNSVVYKASFYERHIYYRYLFHANRSAVITITLYLS